MTNTAYIVTGIIMSPPLLILLSYFKRALFPPR